MELHRSDDRSAFAAIEQDRGKLRDGIGHDGVLVLFDGDELRLRRPGWLAGAVGRWTVSVMAGPSAGHKIFVT